MEESLLISVFVPTTNERGDDFKGEIGECATGYPVGRNLILTARHVLHPQLPNPRDFRYPVAIGWHDFRSNIADDDIVWEGQDELDVALIRCCRPPGVVGWGIVSRDQPRDKVQWISKGFAGTAKCDQSRHPSRFSGEVCSQA